MNTLTMLFITVTATYHLPPGLLSSICYVESKYDIKAVHHDDGNSDSLGVCQIKLETARWLGFKGTKQQLMEPANNVHYAGKYLSTQLIRYGNITPMAVAAYNSGTYRPNQDGYAKNQRYVNSVFKRWAKGK